MTDVVMTGGTSGLGAVAAARLADAATARLSGAPIDALWSDSAALLELE